MHQFNSAPGLQFAPEEFPVGYWLLVRMDPSNGQIFITPTLTCPPLSQTPAAAVSESFTDHLLRPRKSRAPGKRGKFEMEGLCGISLLSSHLLQLPREISPSGSAYSKHSLPWGCVTPRKQVLHWGNVQMPDLELRASLFLISSFQAKCQKCPVRTRPTWPLFPAPKQNNPYICLIPQ